MTREEAIDRLKEARAGHKEFLSVETFNMAIKALEQEPCDDEISRQAVLNINENHHGQMPNHINHQIWQEIKDLPSVSTKKTGHWIDRFPLKECKCSECDYLIMLSFGSFSEVVKQMKYCPNCGAKMEVEE